MKLQNTPKANSKSLSRAGCSALGVEKSPDPSAEAAPKPGALDDMMTD